jgi:hypothetical protein
MVVPVHKTINVDLTLAVSNEDRILSLMQSENLDFCDALDRLAEIEKRKLNRWGENARSACDAARTKPENA